MAERTVGDPGYADFVALSPDARNSSVSSPFVTFRQVDALVDAREGDPDTGFLMRLLMLCSLPRSNPGTRLQYVRHNGPYRLTMAAVDRYGLPFGNLPRLLLAWICTEAVRTQSRELKLGRSIHEFMERLGIQSSDSGGRTGVRTRLRNQMNRLFHTAISFAESDGGRERFTAGMVVSGGELWWDPKEPGEPVLFESAIRLGEEFFAEIIRRPVPLDMHTLKALSRSPLGLDLYMWLVYRTFTLAGPLQLSWKQVYAQFGARPGHCEDRNTIKNFRKDALRELKKIRTAWPGLQFKLVRGGIEIRPSKPPIDPVAPTPRRVPRKSTTAPVEAGVFPA